MTTATAENVDSVDQPHPTDLVSAIVEGFGTFSRKKAEILHAIALFDALGLAPRLGSSSTAMWMIAKLAISHSAAHEYVKVARAMLEFTVMAGAFLEGRTNYSKVRLILPHLTLDDEQELVDLACQMPYHELALALLRFRSGQGER